MKVFEFRFMFHRNLFPRVHWIDNMSSLVQIIRYPIRRQAIIWTSDGLVYGSIYASLDLRELWQLSVFRVMRLSRHANEHIQTEAMSVTKCIGLCHQELLKITTGLHFRGVSNLSSNGFIGQANVWFGYITQGTNAMYFTFAKHEVPCYRGGSKTMYRVYAMNYRHSVLCFALLWLWGYFLLTDISWTITDIRCARVITWWRHQMETFSALLALCAGNWPVTDEFPTQRPVTRCFDVFFDLRLNKRLSKQSWGRWF